MASVASLKSQFLINPLMQPSTISRSSAGNTVFPVRRPASDRKRSLSITAAVGELSADSTTYLFIGAATIALIGTAFPVLFSRKDTCPECDGAGFVRRSGTTLRANAARKDQAQIVCPRCTGLGKLNQIDK